ncbi:glycosyltransferase family 4 protein [Paenibacillus pasadenensis]|nr:glycosyltransferase family 4 protein [Paenibacillus pasadenensis]
MKVAIVHDWLVTYAGAEKVLEELVNLFPEAEIYSVVDFLPESKRDFIQNKKVHTTFIQKLPFAKKRYRNYLPLMPLAVEQLDFSSYDLIISSSYAVAKGIITGPDQIHISYTHSPIRYAWDLQHQYLKESNLQHGLKGWLAKWMLGNIRIWDYRTASGVDYFIANSNFIAKRIWKVYRREAKVIYPPVDCKGFAFKEEKEDFYLTASRMVPYKRIDLIVEAFSTMPDKKLIVIGEGPEFDKIKLKSGPNVSLLGYQPFEVLKDHMQRAKAFVFAAEEDFGITPVEAQACGTPVIAFGKGGVKETVLEARKTTQPTGVFFNEQTVSSLVGAVREFEENRSKYLPQNCHDNAIRFSVDTFKAEMTEFIQSVLVLEDRRESSADEKEYADRGLINTY